MSHLLRAVLVTSMLAGTASVHAGETAHRQDLNESRTNGGRVNGLQANGTQLNRLAFNGMGDKLPKQLNGVSLNSVTLR